jgi:hypothetical protein
MNRRNYQLLRMLLVIPAYSLLAIPHGNAEAIDYADVWRQPLEITLPEPTRNVVLASMVDAADWVVTNGIEDARLVRQGRQTLVQFGMSDEAWSQQQPELCQQSGVSACESTTCQTIQFSATATNAQDAEAVKARIVKNAPELNEMDADDGAGGMCTAAPLAALAANETGAGTNLALDLDLRKRGGASRSSDITANPDTAVAPGAAPNDTFSSAPAQPADATTPANTISTSEAALDSENLAATTADLDDPYSADGSELVSADFQLQVGSNVTDGAALRSDHLPSDTSEYSLLVGEGCQTVTVPLSSVAPAHVPRLLVALINGATVATIAGRYGLTVLSESTLGSTGETLAVFLSVQPVAPLLPLMLLDSTIIAAEHEHIYTTTAQTSRNTPSYSDPLARFTYGPQQTGALALHAASTGAGQTIAVIDTGMALGHPDLAGRVEHEDFTGKGWSADAHGTAVAGIIAAEADNALGSYGVAPQAKILALKACQPNTPNGLAAKCWTSSLVRALDAAIQKDAQIINMSLAGPPDNILARYVAHAVQQNRLIVAGAGNGGPQAHPAFPAALPGVLAVTAINATNAHYASANRGSYIDVAAPGVDIVHLAPDGSFPMSSGTSWAAAHVSGVAALLGSLNPLANAADMSFMLRSHSKDLGLPGPDERFGAGVVDACAAAAAVTSSEVTCARLTETEYVPR